MMLRLAPLLLASLVPLATPLSAIPLSAHGHGGARPTCSAGARATVVAKASSRPPISKKKSTREEQLQKREAGIKALKALAAIYRERGDTDATSSRRATSARAATPAQAPPPPSAPTAPMPPPEEAESSNLLGTLGALAAAQVELTLLRQRDAILEAPEKFVQQSKQRLRRAKADLEAEVAELQQKMAGGP